MKATYESGGVTSVLNISETTRGNVTITIKRKGSAGKLIQPLTVLVMEKEELVALSTLVDQWIKNGGQG